MDFENEDARLVFLRYATPCSKVLVKRGLMKKDYFNNLIEAVAGRTEIPQNAERNFELAMQMCNRVAEGMHKDRIDEEVVRKYFWFVHDDVAKRRYETMRDFKLRECIVYPGEVLGIGKKALVYTPVTTRNYRADFVPNLAKGYNVTVHYDFVVEVIPKNKSQLLWKLKG